MQSQIILRVFWFFSFVLLKQELIGNQWSKRYQTSCQGYYYSSEGNKRKWFMSFSCSPFKLTLPWLPTENVIAYFITKWAFLTSHGILYLFYACYSPFYHIPPRNYIIIISINSVQMCYWVPFQIFNNKNFDNVLRTFL